MTFVPRPFQSHLQPCLTLILAIQPLHSKIIPVLVCSVNYKPQEMCGIQSFPLLMFLLIFLFVVLPLIRTFILPLVLVPHSLVWQRMTTACYVQLAVDPRSRQCPWHKLAHISSSSVDLDLLQLNTEEL